MFQAGPFPAPEAGVFAPADPEMPVDEMDGLTRASGRAERAEVAGAVVLDLSAHVDPGELLADGQLEIGKALVVLEPEVELRPVLLDVVVLEEGGFFLGAGQDVVDVGRLPQDVPDLDVRVGQEIGADPVAEGARLADVEDLAGGVPEEIDTGLGRETRRPWTFSDPAMSFSRCRRPVRGRARAPASSGG